MVEIDLDQKLMGELYGLETNASSVELPLLTEERKANFVEGAKLFIDLAQEVKGTDLEPVLMEPRVQQIFTGIAPTLYMSQTFPTVDSLKKDVNGEWVDPEKVARIGKLLEERNSNIQLVELDITKVHVAKRRILTLVNRRSIEIVAGENRDLMNEFYILKRENEVVDDILDHAELWPMVTQPNRDRKDREVFSGLMSGYPRNIAEAFAEQSTMGFGRKFWARKPFEYGNLIRDVKGVVVKAGVTPVIYDAFDIPWIQMAANMRLLMESLAA